jgi:hypothetical protein
VKLNRRDFIKMLGLTAAGLAVGVGRKACAEAEAVILDDGAGDSPRMDFDERAAYHADWVALPTHGLLSEAHRDTTWGISHEQVQARIDEYRQLADVAEACRQGNLMALDNAGIDIASLDHRSAWEGVKWNDYKQATGRLMLQTFEGWTAEHKISESEAAPYRDAIIDEYGLRRGMWSGVHLGNYITIGNSGPIAFDAGYVALIDNGRFAPWSASVQANGALRGQHDLLNACIDGDGRLLRNVPARIVIDGIVAHDGPAMIRRRQLYRSGVASVDLEAPAWRTL